MLQLSGRHALIEVYLGPLTHQPESHIEPFPRAQDLGALVAHIKELRELSRSSSLLHDTPALYDIMVEHSRNPTRNAVIYEDIHTLLSPYSIRAGLYVQLGRAFEELDLTPSSDLQEAITYATALRALDDLNLNRTTSSMNWNRMNHRPHALKTGFFGKTVIRRPL